MMGGMFDPVLI